MKKFISIITALAFIPASAAYASKPDKGERVTLIVKVKGDAVLENKEAARIDIELFSEAEEAENEILDTQEKVQSQIKKEIDRSAETEYSYTYAFNGFSVETYEENIDRIKALSDVEEVYISHIMDAPEAIPADTYIENGGQMMNIDYMKQLGISGQGMVIAVIDDGFDTNHEYFQGSIEGARLSKADIGRVIDENNMSAIDSNKHEVTVNRVYRSEKIPFAFNYYTGTADTYNSESAHGTHVAGIAAGNNGADPYEGSFVGAAPDAQLLLMACSRLTDSALIKAIDDSVKLGADVINGSWGIDYSEAKDALSAAVENAVSSGVIFCGSASNAGRGYGGKPINPENIDYGTVAAPSYSTSVTSIASANNTKFWDFYNELYVGDEVIRASEENESVSFSEKFTEETEYEYCGIGNEDDFKDKDLTGKIAVISGDKAITFAKKTTNALKAGAAGIVFINTEEARPIGINQASLGKMPAVTVELSDGDKLLNSPLKSLHTAAEMKTTPSENKSGEMSSFSSWGVGNSLELKPELTAPGGRIYSSVNNDEYKNMNGTSMASPYMAGAAALLKQYFKANSEKYNTEPDNDMNGFIENMAMTTASVMYQDKEEGIPFSPRQQGAGLADLRAAVKSPVTLIGDVTEDKTAGKTEKSKISLREIKDTFELEFKVRNHTNAPVTYDNISMAVITDDVDKDGNVGDMKKLAFDNELPGNVTVGANSETAVTIPVTLSKSELEENMKIFTNGFYIDGYVFLSDSADNLPEISIPFTGFYGDWDSASLIDKPYTDKGSILKATGIAGYKRRTNTDTPSQSIEKYYLGENLFADEKLEDYEEYNSEEFAGVSPDGNDNLDYPVVILGALRRLGRTKVAVMDEDGDILSEHVDENNGSVYYTEKFHSTYLTIDKDFVSLLEEGDYKMRAETCFAGSENGHTESAEFKFYVDRTKPSITKFEIHNEGAAVSLDIEAEDNRHLMGFTVSGIKNGKSFYKTYPVKGLQRAEQSIDLTGVNLKSLTVEAVDYAFNSSTRSYAGLNISYGGNVSGTSTKSHIFTVKNTTGAAIDATLILALYRGGRSIGVFSDSSVISNGNSGRIFETPNVLYDTMKVFVWNSTGEPEPLYSAFNID